MDFSLNFLVPLIFALALFAGLVIPAMSMRKNLHDRRGRDHSARSADRERAGRPHGTA